MKTFNVLREVVKHDGKKNRKYIEVQCVNCKMKALMSRKNAAKSKRFNHQCGDPIVYNKWLTMRWV